MQHYSQNDKMFYKTSSKNSEFLILIWFDAAILH